ncbi:hypothetical protein OS493_019248 [Desmophyllum pertusum]|uniref:Uncharacterized protein n=1 Tax=Desmophyllum pertusum TaxID=174260 RepID=A0A9W9YF57_9CNID|nr:hypothetical protein OS493_019248 [Desmophyllum pertusum]
MVPEGVYTDDWDCEMSPSLLEGRESKTEDQPRKRIRPTSLAIIPLSSAADNCYESPSSSFVFTDLGYHASHTKFDLTQRKTEEEWNIHDLDGCRMAFCYEANCSMHHFVEQNY